jgi:Lrp/AsnC family leucine-responsive transcriptional regulator
MKRSLSPSDRRILRVVQAEGRITNAALSDKVGLAPSPCLRRLKALEDEGVVEGYRAIVNRKALGFEVEAFVFMKLEQSEPGWRTRLVERIRSYEEVIACTRSPARWTSSSTRSRKTSRASASSP